VFTVLVLSLSAYLILLTYFVRKLTTALRALHLPRLPHAHQIPSLRFPKWVLYYILTLGVLGWGGISWFRTLPSVHDLARVHPAQSSNIYDRHGTLLFQIYQNENRSLVALADIPRPLIEATLAAEDKNFYHHVGIDPVGIARALYNNISCYVLRATCSSVQGGSTITQQLVKNTLLTPERTMTRKVKEAVLALLVEATYTKDQILEMYLNQVSYGGTAYGIVEASRQYFGKNLTDLTLGEMALLAGLPVSPTVLSPFGTTPYLSQVREQEVLERMVENGTLSEDEKVHALQTPLVLHPEGIQIRAPHFVMYVKNLLVQTYGEDVVSRGGLQVTTTLDLSYQDILQSEINHELDKLEKLNVQNGAGLITNPTTGEILAMVGSRDFFDTRKGGQVNVTIAERQPGSSIKPITYALALMSGLSPSSTIDDAPICYKNPGSPDWCPKNYDGAFHGTVTLRTALASSYNIPATKLLNSLGLTNFISLARALGITSWSDPSRYGLSLTLGGGEVKMVDMAEVYGTFAAGGIHTPLRSLIAVKNAAGADLPLPNLPDPETVLPAYVAYQISDILSDNAARAPAFGTRSVLAIKDAQVAVKTGTTNNLRDNWTFGYTPNLLVATWVGNNDNTPMSSVASGVTGASPIWSRTMSRLLAENPSPTFPRPSELVKVALCQSSHLPYCKNRCDTPPVYDYFVKGHEPKANCDLDSGQIL
jgi:penicillin-binding protein 1C